MSRKSKKRTSSDTDPNVTSESDLETEPKPKKKRRTNAEPKKCLDHDKIRAYREKSKADIKKCKRYLNALGGIIVGLDDDEIEEETCGCDPNPNTNKSGVVCLSCGSHCTFKKIQEFSGFNKVVLTPVCSWCKTDYNHNWICGCFCTKFNCHCRSY